MSRPKIAGFDQFGSLNPESVVFSIAVVARELSNPLDRKIKRRRLHLDPFAGFP